MTADLYMVEASYDGRLVALSIVIAVLASYVSLDLAAHVAAAKGGLRAAWLAGGGIAMGSGIWSMHYTGMLACRLPFPIWYHVPTVLFSLAAAIFSSLIALFAVSRRKLTTSGILLGSGLMGAGVVTMHYSGMAAMRMAAMHHYSPGWVSISVALAPAASGTALWLATRVRGKLRRWKLLSSVIMGLGISSVHYSGMAAVSYMPSPVFPRLTHATGISVLANCGIVSITLIVLGFASLASLLDNALSRQAEEIFGLQAKLMAEHDTVVREVARVRLLLNSTSEGILGLGMDGNCTFCNRAALQHLGYNSDAELVGTHLHDIIHHIKPNGEPYPEAECPFGRAIAEGLGSHIDGELFWRADGSSFPVECWIHPIQRDQFTLGAVLTFWDATKRKQAEEAQRRSDQLFRSIAESTADLIAVVDKQGNRVYNNPSYLRILGYTPAELKETISFEQIHPDDRGLVMHAAEESLRTGVGRVLEYRMQRKDGTYVSLESHGSFIRNSKGEIEALVISARDIGPRKLAAQAEKLGAIGQLAAGIAHEINTPVQYVSDNVCFLRDTWAQIETVMNVCATPSQSNEEPADSEAENDDSGALTDWSWLHEEVPKAIAQSLDGIHRITKIVSAMRKFSHSSRGERELVDINDALETTLTVAHNELKHVADSCVEFQKDLPRVECVPDEMNQVFLNLIVNAAHAMRDASHQPGKARGRLMLRTRQIDDEIQIEIEDNGTGIPEHVRSRVFEPFFTTKQVGEGTGQGLTIAYDIAVHKHQGKMWFETESGKGTTFFLRIPLHSHPGGDKK